MCWSCDVVLAPLFPSAVKTPVLKRDSLSGLCPDEDTWSRGSVSLPQDVMRNKTETFVVVNWCWVWSLQYNLMKAASYKVRLLKNTWYIFLYLCQYHTVLIIVWSQGVWFLQLPVLSQDFFGYLAYFMFTYKLCLFVCLFFSFSEKYPG